MRRPQAWPALRAAEVPYTAAVAWRNRRYDRGDAPIRRAGVPVVSVGNLTLGGTGKTPMVQWIAQWFRRQDVRVAIISRGYKAQQQGASDEGLELRQKLPDVPHLDNLPVAELIHARRSTALRAVRELFIVPFLRSRKLLCNAQ